MAPVVLFAAIALIVWAWNRLFEPVPVRIVLLFSTLVTLYLARTLFTSAVDLPGNLAFHAYPWAALDRPAVRANTGIVFTQLVPWTETARRSVFEGDLPLWNRASGAGSPLLANQQTAIFHPFTIIGLPLSIGDAWTVSVGLRLFTLLFFFFIFLRLWDCHPLAAVFGAVCYSFATFHIIWLLFPLGLATMALPVVLAGLEESFRRPRWRSFGIATGGLVLAVLGGHPESAAWVFVTAAAYCLYRVFEKNLNGRERAIRLAGSLSAGLAAILLTSFFWYPTFRLLPLTDRYQVASSPATNPPSHGITGEWLLPLIAPNILGRPQDGSYRTPVPQHPFVLSDYGELASGYAGVATLAFALMALFHARRPPLLFFLGAAAVAFLTIYETPGWYWVVRKIPLLGITQHQRLRIIWVLGVCVAAALTLDALLRNRTPWQSLRNILKATLLLVVAIYFFRIKEFLAHDDLARQLGYLTLAVVILILLLQLANRVSGETFVQVAIAATFLELWTLTVGFNPPVKPGDLYPQTGAIRFMKRDRQPFRMAALGWSFLADTPGYYGLDDVKTTDPMIHARYLELMKQFLAVRPGDYDQIIRDTTSPFFDFLGIRYVYSPPDGSLTDPSFRLVYQGRDGKVYENLEALPRYYFPAMYEISGSTAIHPEKMRRIGDFEDLVLVDHVPAKIRSRAPNLNATAEARNVGSGGTIRIVEYSGNETILQVRSEGWNLLVSSDVHWPGWRTYWNGERLPPVVVNGVFLGVFVPPGEGRLRLRYGSGELDDALVVSGGTALLILSGVLIAALKRR